MSDQDACETVVYQLDEVVRESALRLALGVWGALVPCEDAEAFKATTTDARFLNQRLYQIKMPARLVEGVRESVGEFCVHWCRVITSS